MRSREFARTNVSSDDEAAERTGEDAGVADDAERVGDEQQRPRARESGRADRARSGTRRGRRWCATLFERGADEWADELRTVRWIKYACLGNEHCPTTHRRHVQAYLETTQQQWNRVREVLHGGHVEIAWGPAENNVRYCQKEGDWREFGTRADEREEAGQCRGGDANAERWRRVRHAAENGEWGDIPDDIYVRYYGNLRRMAADAVVRPPDLEDVCGYWIYGPPGYGKSHAARVLFPNHYAKGANKWWDRWNGEPTVIIDDVERNHDVLGHYFKIWADKYSYIGEIKHLSQWLRPSAIVVTSNYSIHDVFGRDNVMEDAIRRRYVEIHFGEMRMDIERFVRQRVATLDNPNYVNVSGPSVLRL